MCRHQILTLSGASTVTNGELNRGERGRSANWHSFASSRSFDEGVRIGHKRNEHSIFGKTNPIRADEGSIKVTSTGAASIGSAGAGACTTEAVVVDVRRSNDAAVENTIGAAHFRRRRIYPPLQAMASNWPPGSRSSHCKSCCALAGAVALVAPSAN